jgi:hypothetical protein
VTRRTRRIPQEVLASLKHEKYLTDQRVTHFVAEVVEGGTATLTFRQSCASSQEMKRITGEMEGKLRKLDSIGANGWLDIENENESSFEHARISFSGAVTRNVSNFEDARKLAGELPTLLANQMNTLSYTLHPLSNLDATVPRLLRNLDLKIIDKTAAAVNAGRAMMLDVKEIHDDDLYKTTFPKVKNQIFRME